MKHILNQLFCRHYYKFDRIDVDHPTKVGYKIAHKTCQYCGKSKNVTIRPNISSSCELSQDNNNGDLVSLVWMIEKLRRREGGCTMNELTEEVKRNFKGIAQIKQIKL